MNHPERARHIEALLGPGTIAFELRGGASPERLFAVERDCISNVVVKRQREFAAGRLCARAGLSALGFAAVALPSGRDRCPQWPPGAVGSITHTNDYCLAVVGLRSAFAALGVDAERMSAVDPGVWRLFMRTEERSSLCAMDEASRQRNATVIFSAKEAFYKCQYALTRHWLGFEDAIVTVGDGAFSIEVLDRSHPAHALASSSTGRYCVAGESVIAVMALPADTLPV
jgi:4'-phosphopantetheinyl transferase EntD